jgi:hypothetical protein
MRIVTVMALFAPLAGLTPGAVLPAYAAPNDITRASVDSSGAQANGGSYRDQISADGRYVAFVSNATNLIPDDTNNAEDVFVKDRQTGETSRVSVVSRTGAQANNGSRTAAISSDGRYVAFYSDASNLVSGDTNGVGDIFVRDRQTGLTTRVSVDSSGNEANGGNSDYYLAISGDGYYVAFPSEATNLVSGDTNNVTDIFVHDCQTGQTRRVSVDSNGVEANGSSLAVNISDDGRYVTFSSSATNLVAGDTNGTRDVFVYDLQTGGTTLVSVNTSGEQADGGGNDPDISGDGRYVVFLSNSHNLSTEGDYYFGKELVYVRDRQIGQTTLASVHSEGWTMIAGILDQPTISSNGRYVAFSFYDKGDNNGILHVWVRNLQMGTSIMVEGGDGSGHSSLTADGKFVAFSSSSSNLVSGDTNGASDIFVREVAYGPERNPTVVSITPKCGRYHDYCPYPTSSSVSFIVIFSEQVTDVGVDDFSLDMIDGITGASITGVSGYGIQYYVTVDTGTGDGKLRLNVVDNDSIKDTGLNPLGGAGTGNGDFTTGYQYWIDKSMPTVTSVVRADANPTTAGTVRFTVSFSEAVWPVRSDDFVLTTTGNISGASITAISPREDEYISSATYTVTVDTGSGDGTLRLDLIDNDSILNSVNQPLGGPGADNGRFTTGEVYTINKAPVPAGDLTRVSVNSSGAQANGISFGSSISGDGRFIAFHSSANNLVSGDVNDAEDAFVHDRQTGITSLVSVKTGGEQANYASGSPGISDDGRYVVFASQASNLITDDKNYHGWDVFVHDRQTGETTCVSVNSSGEQGNDESFNGAISGDGRYVTFESNATNLVNDDTNGKSDVFLHDRQTGETIRISVSSSGAQADGASYMAGVSANGRFVSFESNADNLVNGDTNGAMDVFVRDRQTGETRRVSVASNGIQANDGSFVPGISGNGQYVVFESDATNLVSGDKYGLTHIYVNDLQTGETTRVSVASDGAQMVGRSSDATMSDDGRFVAFDYAATDNYGSALFEIYMHDRQTGATTFASANLNGGHGSSDQDSSYAASLSADGRFLTFTSLASNLITGDTNGAADIFVKEMTYPPDPNPTVSSVSCASGCGPADPVVNFTVNFSENVTGVDPSDFFLTTTGDIFGAAITGVNGTGKEYIVSVNTGTGDGSLRLDVIDDDSIKDSSLNALGGLGAGNGNFTSGEAHSINKADNVAPTVISILRADADYSSADIVHFTITFSESVSSVDASDFALATTGAISSVAVTEVDGTDNIYTVTVNTGAGDGTLRLDVPASATITDNVGNPLAGLPYSSGEAYTIDRNAPVVISILRADTNPTTADSVRFNVTFSEAVSGVDAGDFVLTTTGGISGASITGLSGSANTYTVTVADGSGNGTLRLDLVDNDSILDSANQPLGGAGTGNGSFTAGETYTINKITAPTISVSYRSTGSNDGWVLESSENSNLGGSKNSNASSFRLGDDARDRQYRSILHFPTYYLPDNAVITKAILMIKKQDVVGTNPFTTHQNISVDIRKGLFGNYSPFNLGSLQTLDFEAPADMHMAGTIQNNPVSGWYWALLDSKAYPYINLTDVTQLRLGFQLDDNDDMGDDYIRFYSGDYDAQKDRPHLLIEYYAPR